MLTTLNPPPSQFAIAWAVFFDACALSSHVRLPEPDVPPVNVDFVDWLPGIFTTFGLLVINLIDKERLLSQGSYGGEPNIIWRARLFLFIGFALMAGGLAGSVVSWDLLELSDDLLTCLVIQSLLVLKYIVPQYETRYQYYGYANVSQNVSLMLAAVTLWLAQHASSEYEYNLQL
jgi:hypothetical protein